MAIALEARYCAGDVAGERRAGPPRVRANNRIRGRLARRIVAASRRFRGRALELDSCARLRTDISRLRDPPDQIAVRCGSRRHALGVLASLSEGEPCKCLADAIEFALLGLRFANLLDVTARPARGEQMGVVRVVVAPLNRGMGVWCATLPLFVVTQPVPGHFPGQNGGIVFTGYHSGERITSCTRWPPTGQTCSS